MDDFSLIGKVFGIVLLANGLLILAIMFNYKLRLKKSKIRRKKEREAETTQYFFNPELFQKNSTKG